MKLSVGLTILASAVVGTVLSDWVCQKIFVIPKSVPRVTAAAAAKKTRVPAAEQNSLVDDDDEELIVETETRDVSPVHFLTKIESFSLFSMRLIIYPNGHPSKQSGHVYVYLALVETSSLPMDWEFNAVFTIFLYNQISDNYLCFHGNGRRFNEIKSEWGFPKFISKKSLRDESNGYLVDDKFVLGAEVFVLKRQRVVEHVKLLKPSIYLRTRDWKISEFSKLKHVWSSDEFPMGGFNWKVKLDPKGDYASKNLTMPIYLMCVSARTFNVHQKVNAEFYVRLKGMPTLHDLGKRSHWFTSSDTTWAVSFISLVELHNPKKGFLVDDCCTLQVKISVQVVV